MRILHVITRINQGGTARWLDVLVDEQRRSGHEVLIVSGDVQGAEEEDGLVASLPVIKIPALGRVISPMRDVQAAETLALHYRKLKPDLVNTHTSKAGALGRLANLTLGPRRPTLVHTVHGHLLHGFAGPVGTAAIRETERALGRMSDGIICVGPTTYEGVTQAGIGRGIPVADVLPGARQLHLMPKREARRSLGLDNDAFVVTWMGRLTRQKNPLLALETAVLTSEATWLIAGDGDLRAEVEAAAPPNARVLGWADPGVVLAAADAYAHTAHWEGFPYSVIEALQAGLPVVSTAAVPPVPGVSIVRGSDAAETAQALAAGIRALENAGPADEATIRARSAPFLPSSFMRAHEALYAAATAHRGRVGRSSSRAATLATAGGRA